MPKSLIFIMNGIVDRQRVTILSCVLTYATVIILFAVICSSAAVVVGSEFIDESPPINPQQAVDLEPVNLTESVDQLATDILDVITVDLRQRLEGIFAKTKTAECRAKIATHFGQFLKTFGREESPPFVGMQFPNNCGEVVYPDWRNLPDDVFIGDIQNRTYQPPRNETLYKQANELHLLYGILTHDNPNATIRLINVLNEENTTFIVHVDAKYDDTQKAMLAFAQTRKNVHILEDEYRIRVNWGGFTMVNATLQIMKMAVKESMEFDKFIHLSSSTYPIASNLEIRHRLAEYPVDANFLHVIMQPTKPTPRSWYYFVECDDNLFRIHQLPPLREDSAGVYLFTASQWFIISHDFVRYLAQPPPGSFLEQYLPYVEHVVVADETFFGTVLRNSEFCHVHHNDNFLHLQFDRWESELPGHLRDPRKCPMPDPNHCGRSPTIMTIDYADILELSGDLFARKFEDSVDTHVKDVVDQWRAERAKAILEDGIDPGAALQMKKFEFEGHGVLIAAKDTLHEPIPLCLALPESGNSIQLLPCFHKWVPPTLAPNWETGAVVLSEVMAHTRWEVGPCTSDGKLERLENGEMYVTLGQYSATGPRCMLQQMDGLRKGRCFDGGTSSFQPGGVTQVYPCVREWFQFVSVGDGRVAPKGSLYSTIPSHIVRQIHNLGHEQIPYMCLGVLERGNEDEPDWNDERYTEIRQERAALKADPNHFADQDWEPLSYWNEAKIVTTQCTNLGAVIEWVFIPFIDEETETDIEIVGNVTEKPPTEDMEL